MDRRTFTDRCLACLSLTVFQRCAPVHYATGAFEPDGISVGIAEFHYLKRGRPVVREYIVVRHDALQFPIFLHRVSDTDYSAVLMKCTHQGNELTAAGDRLACHAHGSEFTHTGTVVRGPADENLRRFRVHAASDRIFIDLRA